MTIYRLAKEKHAKVERVHQDKREEVLTLLSGYWQDAQSCLEDGATLWTPFAYYSKSREELETIGKPQSTVGRAA